MYRSRSIYQLPKHFSYLFFSVRAHLIIIFISSPCIFHEGILRGKKQIIRICVPCSVYRAILSVRRTFHNLIQCNWQRNESEHSKWWCSQRYYQIHNNICQFWSPFRNYVDPNVIPWIVTFFFGFYDTTCVPIWQWFQAMNHILSIFIVLHSQFTLQNWKFVKPRCCSLIHMH